MTYRQSAIARSSSIEQLAEQTRAAQRAGVVPSEVQSLPAAEVRTRLELAVGSYEDRGSFWLWILCCLLWMVVLSASRSGAGGLFPIVVLLAIASTFAGFRSTAAAARRRRAAVERALSWADSQPFEISGYRDWLVSDIPMMALRLRTPIDPKLLRDAIAAIDPSITTSIIDDKTVSISIPARTMTDVEDRKAHNARFGNIEVLARMFERCIVPLHSEVGVERVAMGGTVRR